MEIFWRTIALYNASTWIYQLIILAIGIGLTFALVCKPNSRTKMSMKIYLIFLYIWIAFVYYHIYCAERSYNDVLALFWAMMAVIWIWDAANRYTTFERSYQYDKLAYLLLAMPFIYPAFSIARGLSFPGITSPVMPCSVTVFTIGLLLLFSKKINMFIILFLSHWSLIGLSKTYYFNIPEDFLLASATVPALYLFFKEYVTQNLHMDTRPKAKYVNLLLVLVCVTIGILLMTILCMEVAKNR